MAESVSGWQCAGGAGHGWSQQVIKSFNIVDPEITQETRAHPSAASCVMGSGVVGRQWRQIDNTVAVRKEQWGCDDCFYDHSSKNDMFIAF